MNQKEKLTEATMLALKGKLVEEDEQYSDEVTLKESDNFKLVGFRQGHTFYYLSIKPKSHLKFSTDIYVRSKRGIINDIEIGTSSYGTLSAEEIEEVIATLKEEVNFVKDILDSDRDYKDQIDKLTADAKRQESKITESVQNMDWDLLEDLINDNEPMSSNLIEYGFNLDRDNMSLTLYAQKGEDGRGNDDEDAINKIEEWVKDLAEGLPQEMSAIKEALLADIDTDWYSGMSFSNYGDDPYTYEGFTYDVNFTDYLG